MTKKTLLLALLLVGCAPSRPYARGTPPPAAPAFSPTLDAPHRVGLPAPSRPLQRPPARPWTPQELRKQGRPGLWAVAPNDPADAPDELHGLKLPPVLGVPGAQQMAVTCADRMGRVFQTLPEAVREQMYTADAVLNGRLRCFSAQLYALCISEERMDHGEADPAWARYTFERELAFIRWVRDQCPAHLNRRGHPTELDSGLQEAIRAAIKTLRGGAWRRI